MQRRLPQCERLIPAHQRREGRRHGGRQVERAAVGAGGAVTRLPRRALKSDAFLTGQGKGMGRPRHSLTLKCLT